jgi:hypothetical protein
MKPFIAVFIVALTCGLTHSYTLYGSKRFNRAPAVDSMLPVYTPSVGSQPQYYDKTAGMSYLQPQPQYLSVPYPPQQQQQPRVVDDYNYNDRNPNPSYYYYPRQDYQTPLYGIPTYRGDYQPKPYYFAQPSYSSSDDHLEATNPLDYLHEEILQENERERTMNNAAFMQNLALYNKQVDSLQERQQQIQQMQDMYNLKSSYDPQDYDVEIETPNDWYDQTSVVMDQNNFDEYRGPQASAYQSRPSDYDDEMVKELRGLKQSRKSKMSGGSNQDWQRDMPAEEDDVVDQDYEENDDDTWINWGQKRDIQPKKDTKPTTTTTTTTSSPTTEGSKLLAKLRKGQKEVVLPRPAAPVRKPFTEPIMNMMKANSKSIEADVELGKSQPSPPIYKTIKQIIDMEQNLSHVSRKLGKLFIALERENRHCMCRQRQRLSSSSSHSTQLVVDGQTEVFLDIDWVRVDD